MKHFAISADLHQIHETLTK